MSPDCCSGPNRAGSDLVSTSKPWRPDTFSSFSLKALPHTLPWLPTMRALLVHQPFLPTTTPPGCTVTCLVFRKESRFLVGGQLGDLGMGREPHTWPLLRERPSMLSGAPEIQVGRWGSQVCPRQDCFPLREASGGGIHCMALTSQHPGPGSPCS